MNRRNFLKLCSISPIFISGKINSNAHNIDTKNGLCFPIVFAGDKTNNVRINNIYNENIFERLWRALSHYTK